MSAAHAHAKAPAYRRRTPEEEPLYQVLAEHLESFLERTRSSDRLLPAYVEQELRAYLDCGILYVQSEIMCSWSIFSCDIGL